MFTNSDRRSRQRQSFRNCYLALAAFALMVAATAAPIRAQCSFSSVSTGADGAFNPVASQTVTLPPSGVFNFTTVNIPRGVTIKFTRNANNTPVTILASSITIVGTLDVSGSPGTQSVFGSGANSGAGAGGPGGFDGGRGGFGFAPFFTGIAGDGPGGGGGGLNNSFGGGGGGFASAGGDGPGGRAGLRYGTRTLVPLIGGSGGGGGGTGNGVVGFGGGGGAGAILLAASGTITLGDALGGGSILANGGSPAGGVAPTVASAGGAGGAIRMVANTITGRITLQVQGGGVSSVNSGGHGYIRVEACSFNGFQPTPSPVTTSTGDAIISLASPSSVVFPNAPTLSITSVAGIAAPATPVGSFNGTPDIVVPTAQANPVAVTLQAANVPLGTVVSVMVVPENGASATVQGTGLAGTVATSTAGANVNLPASGASLISAQLIFTPTGNGLLKSELRIDGEPVKRVEISTKFGGQSEVTYITESGKRIKR